MTLTTLVCGIGAVEPTPGGAEREDVTSCTFGRPGRPVVKFFHFQRTLRL